MVSAMRKAAGFLPRRAVLGTAALRLGALGSRLLLTLYIARFLGIEAVAVYGFVVGASAAMIALSGLGLDFRMGRLCVASDAATAALRVRDRTVLRFAVQAVVLAMGLTTLLALRLATAPVLIWGAVIVMLEPVAYDLHESLIYRFKPFLGNLILFLRSGAWIPVVLAAGLIWPAARTVGFVLASWGVGLVFSVVVVVSLALGSPAVRKKILDPIDWGWIGSVWRSAPLVYLSELGYAGMIYGDRYIVAVMLGARAAGAFTLVWTFTNATVPIVQAGVFNQVGPRLAQLWQAGQRTAWGVQVGEARRAALITCVVCGLGVLAAIAFALPLLGFPNDAMRVGLAAIMVVGITIRMQSEVLHTALYSAERDRAWTWVNIVNLVVSPLISIACIAALGLWGAAAQMIVMATLVLVLRGRLAGPTLRQAATAAP